MKIKLTSKNMKFSEVENISNKYLSHIILNLQFVKATNLELVILLKIKTMSNKLILVKYKSIIIKTSLFLFENVFSFFSFFIDE